MTLCVASPTQTTNVTDNTVLNGGQLDHFKYLEESYTQSLYIQAGIPKSVKSVILYWYEFSKANSTCSLWFTALSALHFVTCPGNKYV